MLVNRMLAALAILPALLAPLAGQAEARYTVTRLPDFIPTDINNSGQMSGYVAAGGTTNHAVFYSGGTLIDLGTFGGDFSFGNAINDAGTVTGTAFSDAGGLHGFIYSNGSVVNLANGTNAFGINAHGDVVGQISTGDGTFSGFLYHDGDVTALDRLGTGTTGLAYDINDRGKIVGESNIDPELHSPFHPVLYRGNSIVDLGTLADYEFNTAQAINNAGQIAGASEAADGSIHAFLYQHGLLTDLGGFGGLFLDVGGINERGTFAGTSWTSGNTIGYIGLNGALVDLNTLVDPALGWEITQAMGINDSGQIVGIGCRDDACGAVRLDLASAVPEPAGALLLLPGLVVVAGTRRRAMRHGGAMHQNALQA